ncbi:unnamed protein product [Rotaria sp. Silwood1]|nr:unnamed protein product [Rotaria sp. Silwood1]CAF4818324.1 unnamed protein product [Rotaria sp. Silwood1]
MTEQMEQLRIIAQPKAFFRERYGSELDQAENTAKRYIRAEDNNQLNLEYPTIEISGTWYGTIDHPYIRVASVTVPNENVSMACMHPYPINSDEPNVRSYLKMKLFINTIDDEINLNNKTSTTS